MNSSTVHKSVPLGWKVAILAPSLTSLVLLLYTLTLPASQALRFRMIANLFTPVTMIAVGVYWVEFRKEPRWGMAFLVLGGAVLGYGLGVVFHLL